MTATDAHGPGAGGAAAGAQHEWLRMDAAWHALYATAVVLAAALVLADGGPVAGRVAALVVLAAAAVGYVLLARPSFADEGHGWRGALHVALASPLVLALFVLVPAAGGALLFTLYPHVWRMLPMRAAAAVTVLVTGGVAAIQVADALVADPAVVPALVGWMGGVLLVALALGFWIQRVTAQSVHRAELLAQLEATRAELAAVSRNAGVLAERERLARDIHDTLAQGFTSIRLLADAADGADDPAPALRRISAVARDNLAESRALVAALAPAGLADAGLPGALRRLAARFGDDHGVEVAVEVTGEDRTLPPAVEVALLRVAQESLTNVGKHAAATAVSVVLDHGGGDVLLAVRDDGRGFAAGPLAAPGCATGGYGLSGMRSRVAALGGTLTVAAAPGAGTTVTAALPLTAGDAP